jgi:hypothetical protein
MNGSCPTHEPFFFETRNRKAVGNKAKYHRLSLHLLITCGDIGFDSVAPLTPYGGIITGKRATDSL